MENKIRTIRNLRDTLRGGIYVYLRTQDICRRFYADAEAEGFCFGNTLPTESPLDDIIAIDEDEELKLSHTGFVGHMKFHYGRNSSGQFYRIDYEKYIAGDEDFCYGEAGDVR